MESTELMHYGVKGMKWGVRKKPEPYIQDLGGGVTAKWPSKKAFKKASQACLSRDVISNAILKFLPC